MATQNRQRKSFMKYELSLSSYAFVYAISRDSARRYKKLGLPLDDAPAAWEALSNRRTMPARTRRKGLSAITADLERALDGDKPSDEAIAANAELAEIVAADAEALNAAKLQKITLECERLKFQLEAEKALYTRNEEIRERLAILLERHCTVARRIFVDELPPKCAGLGAAEIQIKNREATDEFFRTVSKPLDSSN
jgi:hypothetical protein